MGQSVKCERNARPNLSDDRFLEIALLALASIKDCCGDGSDPSAPHDDDCPVVLACPWLEYHAGVLSKLPAADHGLPMYSGDLSAHFWRRVNAIEDEELHSELYSLGCELQNLEERALAALAEAERAVGIR